MKTKNSKIFFLGIGGIGMSAVAQYFIEQGYQVMGYDRTESKITKNLMGLGAHIVYDDNKEIIQNTWPNNDYEVIFTPAIKKGNQFFDFFVRNGLPMIKRSEVLGKISQNSINLSVAGTHGKTTTSSILAHIFYTARKDMTAFVGGLMTNYNNNYISYGNKSDYSITEADEFDKSFLKLSPNYAIITSIDLDHTDIYSTEKELLDSFQEFAQNISKNNIVIHENVAKKLSISDAITYGSHNANALIYDAIGAQEKSLFNISYKGIIYENVELGIAGFHNIENATAAFIISLESGINEAIIRLALKSYKGVKRRFEYILTQPNVFIDDYAHHPTEIENFISSVKAIYPNHRIIGIFQPHTYTRTLSFYKEFAQALSLLDELLLLPIYAARERPIERVNSELILKSASLKNKKIVSKNDLINIKLEPNDILLTIGAGDIGDFVNPIKNSLR